MRLIAITSNFTNRLTIIKRNFIIRNNRKVKKLFAFCHGVTKCNATSKLTFKLKSIGTQKKFVYKKK